MKRTFDDIDALPRVLPVFPLAGAVVLPRGQLPLNIFEPRYLAMVDDALKANRLIGMIQPDEKAFVSGPSPALHHVGCAGRITQLAEMSDGRYVITLTGVARFDVAEELRVTTPYRQCAVSFERFAGDLLPRPENDGVDRESVLRTLRLFADTNRLKLEWSEIDHAPNEALVNALSMMSPFSPGEKQALLEAADLKTRAEVLVAITEIEMARDAGGRTPLQ
ncbi:MAG: peptidase [Hyphomicrobiales bacterium]|nr:peptidase [Hyphomicrobiales bacterium]